MEVLLNWLWQGSVLTGMATLVLCPARRAAAAARYWFWWVTLLLVLVLPVLQPLFELLSRGFLESSRPLTPVASMTIPITAPDWPVWLVFIIWSAWAGAVLVGALVAVVGVHRARRDVERFPEERANRLRHWMAISAGGRRARLAISGRVRFAAVMGLGTPVIAVAPEVLRALNDEELDRVLVHEWAHVQRRDDVARLLQVLIRMLAGFHPAVWWIDRQLDLEREVACDDRAVEITGSAREYGLCLTKLAGLQAGSRQLSLVAGALSSSDLTKRVVRLLDRHRNRSTRRSVLVVATGTLALGIVTVGLSGLEMTLSRGLSVEGVGAKLAASLSAQPELAVGATAALTKVPLDRATSSRRQRRAPSAGRVVVPIFDTGRGIPVSPGVDPEFFPYIPGAPERPPDVAAGLEPSIDIPAVLTARADHSGALALFDSPTTIHQDSGIHWSAASDAGVAIGRASQRTGLATAGLFTRLGRKIAGAF